MTSDKFDTLVAELRLRMMLAVINALREQKVNFDAEAYLCQTSTDWDQVCKELLFFGADYWPRLTDVCSNLPVQG